MFERYTEKARRVIFFARYEAEQAEHGEIELGDLLAGLCREWPQLRVALGFPAPAPFVGPPRSYSGVPVFSEDCKHILARAEALARHEQVNHEYLLAGIIEKQPVLAETLAAKNFWAEDLPESGKSPRKDPATRSLPPRIGLGYDYHRLVAGRKLILGGVQIAFSKGLAGHSDGDVLTHALCDALLGAAGLGDLGQHFPDTDPQWKDASSLELLARVVDLAAEKGLRVAQIDTVVIAQEPKLAPYYEQMRDALARTLGIEPAQVNVKAKTTEGLEAIGRGEAMAAQAIALLESAR